MKGAKSPISYSSIKPSTQLFIGINGKNITTPEMKCRATFFLHYLLF
jgi:hypothetical protein